MNSHPGKEDHKPVAGHAGETSERLMISGSWKEAMPSLITYFPGCRGPTSKRATFGVEPKLIAPHLFAAMILRLISLANQLLLVAFFIFFSFGLLTCARAWTRADSIARERQSAIKLSQNSGLELLTGVIAFCLFCNLLLILPGILELTSLLNGWPINVLHKICLAIITLAAWVVAFMGAWALLKYYTRSEQYQLRPMRLSRPWDSIAAIDSLSIRVLLIVPCIYLVVAPSIAELNYDTALYHYPSILHFLAFGPELGVANFHFSFGFYNLQQFGQVALQNLSESRFILSPTLNLIFFEVFILVFACHLSTTRTIEDKSLRPASTILSVVSFLLATFLLAVDGGSLVSFDADLAVTLTTLSLVFILYFNGDSDHRRHALFLAFFLPLLKTPGFAGLLLIILMELLRMTLPEGTNLSWVTLLATFRAKIRNLSANKSVLLVITCSYLLMLLTNIITSGYLLFPVVGTGPFGSHAVPAASVRMIKSALVINYARFNNNGAISKTFGDRSTAYSEWLPQFLRTEWGQLIGLWLLAAIFVAFAVVSLKVLRRQDLRLHRLLALSIPMVVITAMALFILPPNPRFYLWIGALIAFEFTELLMLYPMIGFFSLTILMSLLTLRLQRPMLRGFSNEPFTTRNLAQVQLYGWKSRAHRNGTSATVLVRSPMKDKCYAIEPPCTPYIPSAKGMADH